MLEGDQHLRFQGQYNRSVSTSGIQDLLKQIGGPVQMEMQNNLSNKPRNKRALKRIKSSEKSDQSIRGQDQASYDITQQQWQQFETQHLAKFQGKNENLFQGNQKWQNYLKESMSESENQEQNIDSHLNDSIILPKLNQNPNFAIRQKSGGMQNPEKQFGSQLSHGLTSEQQEYLNRRKLFEEFLAQQKAMQKQDVDKIEKYKESQILADLAQMQDKYSASEPLSTQYSHRQLQSGHGKNLRNVQSNLRDPPAYYSDIKHEFGGMQGGMECEPIELMASGRNQIKAPQDQLQLSDSSSGMIYGQFREVKKVKDLLDSGHDDIETYEQMNGLMENLKLWQRVGVNNFQLPPQIERIQKQDTIQPKELNTSQSLSGKSTPKKKGGRPPANDPRLDNQLDPRKAKRILANRESAARSKEKQKEAINILLSQQKMYQFKLQGAVNEMEILKYVCTLIQEKMHNQLGQVQ